MSSFNGRLGIIYSWEEKMGLNLAQTTWGLAAFAAVTIPGLALSYALGPQSAPAGRPRPSLWNRMTTKLSDTWTALTNAPGYFIRHPFSSTYRLATAPIRLFFKAANSTFWFAMRWAMPQALMRGVIQPVWDQWNGNFYSTRAIATLRPFMEKFASRFSYIFDNGLWELSGRSLIPSELKNPGPLLNGVSNVADKTAGAIFRAGISFARYNEWAEPLTPNDLQAKLWYDWSKNDLMPRVGHALKAPRFILGSTYGFAMSAIDTMKAGLLWGWTFINHPSKADFVRQVPSDLKSRATLLSSELSHWAHEHGVDKVCWSVYDAVTDTAKETGKWAYQGATSYINNNANSFSQWTNQWVTPNMAKYGVFPLVAAAGLYGTYKVGSYLAKHRGFFQNFGRGAQRQAQRQGQQQQQQVHVINNLGVPGGNNAGGAQQQQQQLGNGANAGP